VVGGPLGVEVELDLGGTAQPVEVHLRFASRDGRLLATAELPVEAADDTMRADGRVTTRWIAPLVPLAPGQYALSVVVTGPDGVPIDSVDDVVSFTVGDPSRPQGSLAAGLAIPHVVLDGDWTVLPPTSRSAS
jgi:hypothetical protein